jgi:hypothetical protein
MSDNKALLQGYTKEVMVYISTYDLHLFVKPDTDFDDAFKAYDADACQFLTVNGWLISEIEDLN